MRGAGSPGATWPVNGKTCSSTPKVNSRIKPHRNSGIDNNKIEAKSVSGQKNAAVHRVRENIKQAATDAEDGSEEPLRRSAS